MDVYTILLDSSSSSSNTSFHLPLKTVLKDVVKVEVLTASVDLTTLNIPMVYIYIPQLSTIYNDRVSLENENNMVIDSIVSWSPVASGTQTVTLTSSNIQPVLSGNIYTPGNTSNLIITGNVYTPVNTSNLYTSGNVATTGSVYTPAVTSVINDPIQVTSNVLLSGNVLTSEPILTLVGPSIETISSNTLQSGTIYSITAPINIVAGDFTSTISLGSTLPNFVLQSNSTTSNVTLSTSITTPSQRSNINASFNPYNMTLSGTIAGGSSRSTFSSLRDYKAVNIYKVPIGKIGSLDIYVIDSTGNIINTAITNTTYIRLRFYCKIKEAKTPDPQLNIEFKTSSTPDTVEKPLKEEYSTTKTPNYALYVFIAILLLIVVIKFAMPSQSSA
jgi:hypothetical protein